ncbi:glycosyltransferase family 2 protein [Candidatus Roizmanbacteria bacterium]|nr:glycosyltransferase family 2 protein [Candidatus Roizmanbacteria bacterium]
MSLQPSCGPFYTLPVIFGALFLRGDYWGLTRYSPNKVKEVDWISGACILTKKQYLTSIEGFDENIFMYMDEVDLLYRAKKQGYSVFFYPKAEFIHLGSASSGERKYPILQVFKGLSYFYKKHHTAPEQIILRFMLKLKAVIWLIMGYIFNNTYLKETYGKALKLV